MINRRAFLRGSTSLTAAAVAFPSISQSADKTISTKTGRKPRRIIHLVSDGMSSGTLTCADHLSQVVRGHGSTWMRLYTHPAARAGYMNMRSLNSLVTDSAAAACSWGSGTRIINGMMNQSGNGTPLKTLYELLADAGWSRGLVTTAEITHATPAGFAACAKSRDMATKIATQYLDQKIDILLGGGSKFFDQTYRLDKRDLPTEYRDAGYFVMENLAQLSAAPRSKRWLGLFSRSHLPYTLDQIADARAISTIPTLAAMTTAALRRLEGESKFILQVEGGRIDHACHNNDAAAALRDQIAFDEALDVCVEFQKRDPETLLVITTDHGNANLALNGSGDAYGQSTWQFRKLKEIKKSFSTMIRPLKRLPGEELLDTERDEVAEKAKDKAMSAAQKEQEKIRKKKEEENVATPTEIIEIVEEGTGYKMPYRKAELLRLHLANAAESLYDMRKSDMMALADVIANHISIGFTGSAHTADYVPVLALGPGSERFAGFIQNTDVFQHYLHFAGVNFRNPQEPLITGSGPEAHDVERPERYKHV